jgi:hypothetical protein
MIDKRNDRPAHGTIDPKTPAHGERGSRVCRTCLRLFESSASRARHSKRGCHFRLVADRNQPVAFDAGACWRSRVKQPGDAAVLEACLRRTVDAMGYIGFAELVAFCIADPALRNVRAGPRANAHVEVFDGAVWVRRPRGLVMAELINRGWRVMQAFWDRERAQLVYNERSPVHPDHEVSIDMALTSVALEEPAVFRILRQNIGRAIGALSALDYHLAAVNSW